MLRGVTIREVGLCDGLQRIDRVLPTGHKLEWIRRAYGAGIRQMDVGAFVAGRRQPQVSDTAELIAVAKQLPGLSVSVCANGYYGAIQAVENRADQLVMPCSANPASSRYGDTRTSAQVLADISLLRAVLDSAQGTTLLEVCISEAFASRTQEEVATASVVRLVSQLLDAGVDRISLADEAGCAEPAAVSRLIENVRQVAGDRLWSAQFYNPHRVALSNIRAAMAAGIRNFDTSLASLGGSAVDPSVAGTVATEDVVYLLQTLGKATGIDLNVLLDLRIDLASWLPGVPVFGQFGRGRVVSGQWQAETDPINH